MMIAETAAVALAAKCICRCRITVSDHTPDRTRCPDAFGKRERRRPRWLVLATVLLRNLNLLNLRRFFLHDFGRQRRVLQRRSQRLAFGQRPAQELLDLLANILVG